MRYPRRRLVLLGAALALTGCAQEQARYCSTVGCIGAVSVDLDGAVADRITEPTSIRACLASACATSVVLPGERVDLTLTGTAFEIDTLDLTVVATTGGSTVFEATIPVTGERINGAGCSPVCFQTGVVVTEADLTA